MIVRKATPADAPALVEAFFAMMEEAGFGPAVQGSGPARLLASITAGTGDGSQGWFVCEDGGKIVATAGAILQLTPLDDVLVGKRAIIVGVYTHPDYRKRGAARMVVAAAVEWCRAAGVALVRLQTTQAGRPLYESLGFTVGDVMTLRL